MINEIQKLILELKLKKIESIEKMNKYRHDEWRKSIPFIHEAEAFNFCIRKLTLLLKDESKQPQPPDFANTMLGKVPQEVNDGTEEHQRAVEGATPVVRQNEQTKEDGGQNLGFLEAPAAI